MILTPMKLDPIFTATIPQKFLNWYRETFTSTRRIYGHWSGDMYGKKYDGYHQTVTVEADDLDEMVRKLQEAKDRRVGGSLDGYYQQVLELKDEAEVHVYQNAPIDEDLRYHTPKRNENSIAICMTCGHRATVRNLGYVEPLPSQIHAFVDTLVDDCIKMRIPVENFMTHSEAADNLDFEDVNDPAAPHPPHGYLTKRDVWDLELWIEPWTLQVYPPEHRASGAMLKFADYARQEALKFVCERTRTEWENYVPAGPGSEVM